ncbi:MAG: DNA-binding transcriptional regulator, partial [Kiritimatiellae bacterium]|nr:DNA-binding transcriptional regulator [Kiritimatiellia bacterium]
MKSVSVLVLMELYDHRIRQGIGRYAKEHGWFLTFCDGCTHGGASLLPQGWSGDGILTQIGGRPEILRYIRRQRVPCVDLCIFRPDLKMPRITGDQSMIGRVAADHLIERGFRRSVFFATEFQHPHKLREAGFTERFLTLGEKPPQSLVWARQSRNGLDNWRSQETWLKRALRKQPKPIGIFCYSDYDAVKIETICVECGYAIPDDVAIIGVDNDPLVCENVHVPLSSVRHDLVRVGYDGAAMLDRLMQGKPPPATPILIPPLGVETRASTETFTADDPVVRSVLRFFQDNLTENIGVADAARATGLPLHKLKSHFRRASSETVYASLHRLRLFAAKRLLIRTDLSIKEIAAQTGFCHAQHL